MKLRTIVYVCVVLCVSSDAHAFSFNFVREYNNNVKEQKERCDMICPVCKKHKRMNIDAAAIKAYGMCMDCKGLDRKLVCEAVCDNCDAGIGEELRNDTVLVLCKKCNNGKAVQG